ncbi:hypothetical protein ACOSQ4_020427 [Xanthoceras sorbifolium]
MMWNTMENEERERVVAVAVDKDRCSQYALKWAIEHVLGRHQTVKLIHVIQRPPSNSNPVRNDDQELIEQQQPADNNQTMDVFLPFRCYCTRQHVGFSGKHVKRRESTMSQIFVYFNFEM